MAERELNAVDHLFLSLMGLLVFFMQVGFSLFEAGAVRAKNTTNILIKNAVSLFVAVLTFWGLGYAFAWGDASNSFISYSNFFMANLDTSKYSHWFFQFVLAATATVISTGSMSERTNFWSHVVFAFFMTGFIYPISSHWAWHDKGWLQTVSYKDFAGSGVVHAVGGTAALVGAILVRPRMGRFEEGKPVAFGTHAAPLCLLGVFIIFLGFLGMNIGSRGHISLAGDAAAISTATVNTLLGACGGALITYICRRTCARCFCHHWALLNVLYGGMTGMVSVCGGCQSMQPYGAFIVGGIGGLTYISWETILIHCKVDDALNAAPVHLGGGIWGVLAAPLFDRDTGILYVGDKESFRSFGWNLVGLLVMIIWTALLTFLIYGLMKLLGYLRVSEEVELKGLDLPFHEERAFPAGTYDEEQQPPIIITTTRTPSPRRRVPSSESGGSSTAAPASRGRRVPSSESGCSSTAAPVSRGRRVPSSESGGSSTAAPASRGRRVPSSDSGGSSTAAPVSRGRRVPSSESGGSSTAAPASRGRNIEDFTRVDAPL